MYLQPGNPDFAASHDVSADDVARRLTWLVDKTLADAWFTPRILPQLHVMMWGNRRGV
jgi:7-carboxy-7-deazaguanine synthase